MVVDKEERVSWEITRDENTACRRRFHFRECCNLKVINGRLICLVSILPIIALSGALERIVDYKQEYNKNNKLSVDLYEAQLDFIGETGPRVTSAIIVAYDKDKPISLLS